MDDLQYREQFGYGSDAKLHSFKPCYKWMTFNTYILYTFLLCHRVLNLVINGWPSILLNF